MKEKSYPTPAQVAKVRINGSSDMARVVMCHLNVHPMSLVELQLATRRSPATVKRGLAVARGIGAKIECDLTQGPVSYVAYSLVNAKRMAPAVLNWWRDKQIFLEAGVLP